MIRPIFTTMLSIRQVLTATDPDSILNKNQKQNNVKTYLLGIWKSPI
jgi:hypothetical protein